MKTILLQNVPVDLLYEGMQVYWNNNYERIFGRILSVNEKLITVLWEDNKKTAHYHRYNVFLFVVFKKCKKLQAIYDLAEHR